MGKGQGLSWVRVKVGRGHCFHLGWAMAYIVAPSTSAPCIYPLPSPCI